MFDSGIKIADVISAIRKEADISYPISDDYYLECASSIEQMIYSEIFKIQQKIELDLNDEKLTKTNNGVIVDISKVDVDVNEAKLRYEDIHTVFADEIQLIETNYTSGDIFPNCYYKDKNNLAVVADNFNKIKIYYYIRPAIKTTGDENVMLPYEFLYVLKAKLRGEAYKLANEENLAAKWLSDYNVGLDTIKIWVQSKNAKFGQ